MIKAMRSIGLSLLTIGLTTAVIGNAYYQKKQFYPSVVYITKSNPSMAVIYVQSLVFVLMLGKLMRKIFLGSLRAAEFEHLMERFWYALTETCLAFTVFRDDFNPKFVALFTVLLFLKSFHWLAEDRVDYMERSPMIGWLFHIRVASLLIVLACLDYVMISHAYQSTITKGATVQLVFGFEYAILITVVANIAIKYILHATEMRSETPWDNKAVFLLYTELVIGLGRVILYVLFVFIMVRLYTLPLFAFRPMYYTIRSFKKALDDVILSRRAIRNMNTLYPDATPEELALSDNICIICREDMVNSSKKLPCGHIFHTACLRSWFQRQQTCPTCRLNILRTPITVAEPQRAAPIQPNAVQNNQNEQNQNQNNNNIVENVNPFASLFPPNFVPPQLNFPMPTAAPLNLEGNAVMPPPLPFMTPYALPPPPMPPLLDTLSEEELRALEGTERQHVEERIKLLRNIQLMLNASAALMNQYSSVVARLPPPPPPIIATIPPIIPFVEAPPIVVETAASPEIITTITSQATSAAFTDISKPLSTTASDDIKIEDIGSEEYLDIPSVSSSNQESIPSTSQMNFNFNNDTIGDVPETEEIRRRRLQKFLQSEKDDGTA